MLKYSINRIKLHLMLDYEIDAMILPQDVQVYEHNDKVLVL